MSRKSCSPLMLCMWFQSKKRLPVPLTRSGQIFRVSSMFKFRCKVIVSLTAFVSSIDCISSKDIIKLLRGKCTGRIKKWPLPMLRNCGQHCICQTKQNKQEHSSNYFAGWDSNPRLPKHSALNCDVQ